MLLADARGEAQEPAKGLEQLDETVRIINVTQARCADAEIHRIRGKLLIAMGQCDAALSRASWAHKSAQKSVGVSGASAASTGFLMTTHVPLWWSASSLLVSFIHLLVAK